MSKKDNIIMLITMIAVIICIITARAVKDLHIQETVLFLVSLIWIILFCIANRRMWK